MFFFSKNIIYSLSVSVFIASALSSIMKSTVFCFPCLKNPILHLASAAFVLLLKVVLISFMKLSQSWVPSYLSSLSSFFCAYIPTTPPLRQAKITVILSLVSITLLFLRYNCISLHQSSNFVWSLSNYTGSGPMLFDITACIFLFASAGAGAGAGAADISISVFLYLLEAFSMICKDPSCSDNASISFVLLELVLVPFHSLYYMCFVW